MVTACAIVLVATSASCLDPTQITVDITTDVPCADTKGTSLVGGAPGATERASPTTTTRDCENGRVGTLVSTPSNDKDVDASFVVVMGVDRPVSECTAANQFKGCIVERRLIHYIKHTPLNLPITMWLVCKDVACDQDSTCARNGKCVSARIANPSSCSTGPCFLEGEGPYVPGADGGSDAPLGDGAITDGPRVGDADADGPPLVIPPPPPGDKLYCPPVASGCNTGGTCCYLHDGNGGRCNPPCNGGEIAMQCNRKTDCPVANNYCCGTVVQGVDVVMAIRQPRPDPSGVPDAIAGVRTLTATSCQLAPGPCLGAWICTQTVDCPGGMTCDKGSALFNPTGTFGECK